MRTNYVSVNLQPIDSTQCVRVDHTVTEFRVLVRSQSGVGVDTLKNLIQTRHEVVECEIVENTCYVI